MVLASFVAGFTGTPRKQVRYAIPRDIGQALSIALAVQEAENKNDIMKVSMRNSIIQLDCQRGHPVGRARMTIGLSAHLTRQRSITCVFSATRASA